MSHFWHCASTRLQNLYGAIIMRTRHYSNFVKESPPISQKHKLAPLTWKLSPCGAEALGILFRIRRRTGRVTDQGYRGFNGFGRRRSHGTTLARRDRYRSNQVWWRHRSGRLSLLFLHFRVFDGSTLLRYLHCRVNWVRRCLNIWFCRTSVLTCRRGRRRVGSCWFTT